MSFEQFAKASGLIVDRAIPDGRIHRVPTLDKSSKRNGAYKWNGEFGWCQNWQSMDEIAIYRDTNPDPNLVARARREARSALDERQREHANAARRALDIVRQATYDTHPYFALKGLAGEKGLVADGKLIVPMRNHRTQDLQSVQMITAEGEKKFLPGGQAAGAVFALGPRHGFAWLVEGMGTGLSVRRALARLYRDDQVVVCFSSHNLKAVGLAIGKRAYVVADHDRINPQTGKRAGLEAAIATGLPYVMSPVEGQDANDYMNTAGVGALADLLRGIL